MKNSIETGGLSIIVPCKNEETYISLCLDSLLSQNFGATEFEIIVIDNGSTDNTPKILKKYMDKISLYSHEQVSISELRNIGAGKAKYEWFAFIDADVEVDSGWYRNLTDRMQYRAERVENITKIITGSTYDVPEAPTWIERVWFGQLNARDKVRNTYINSGNLIIHSSLFKAIGGFNPEYKTGEDEKLCQDALKYGGTIRKDSLIGAVHHGYPKTVSKFFMRERWHGLAMEHNLKKPWKDRALLLALYDLGLVILLPIGLFYYRIIILPCIVILFFMIAPLAVLAFNRSRKQPIDWLQLTTLFFIYGWAKMFTLLEILFKNKQSGSS